MAFTGPLRHACETKNRACLDLAAMLSEMRFPVPTPRGEQMIAEQAAAFRSATHRLGSPSMAFAVALQRGLASLPLVGGSVALIGSPTAAAVPVTDALLRRYVTFLAREHALALREVAEREQPERFLPGAPPWHPPMWWVPEIDVPMQIAVESAAPSTRAAVVLSAVDVPLSGSTRPDEDGFDAIVERFGPAEDEMAETPADTLAGVVAKARALQVETMRRSTTDDLRQSLADDVWRLFGGGAA